MDTQILLAIARACSCDVSKLHTYTRIDSITDNVWFLATQLEQEFGISLPDSRIKLCHTVGDFMNLVKAKTGSANGMSSAQNPSHNQTNNR